MVGRRVGSHFKFWHSKKPKTLLKVCGEWFDGRGVQTHLSNQHTDMEKCKHVQTISVDIVKLLGSMLPQYMALSVSFVSQCVKKISRPLLIKVGGLDSAC